MSCWLIDTSPKVLKKKHLSDRGMGVQPGSRCQGTPGRANLGGVGSSNSLRLEGSGLRDVGKDGWIDGDGDVIPGASWRWSKEQLDAGRFLGVLKCKWKKYEKIVPGVCNSVNLGLYHFPGCDLDKFCEAADRCSHKEAHPTWICRGHPWLLGIAMSFITSIFCIWSRWFHAIPQFPTMNGSGDVFFGVQTFPIDFLWRATPLYSHLHGLLPFPSK